jgi:hypothetical protein
MLVDRRFRVEIIFFLFVQFIEIARNHVAPCVVPGPATDAVSCIDGIATLRAQIGTPGFVAGTAALSMLLAFEFSVVLYLRGLTFGEYLDSRDWLAGSAYLLSLLVFAAMPAFFYLNDCSNDRWRPEGRNRF